MRHHLPSWPYALVLVIFFSFVFGSAGWLLFEASGYRVLRSPFRLVKTGLLSLSVHPAEKLTVTVNGQILPEGQLVLPDLSPGRYVIQIGREGFTTWQKTTEIVAGEAQTYSEIILFYDKPVRTPIPVEETEIFKDLLLHPELFQAGLQILGNEVWADESLVTRFSSPITMAMWLPSKTHLLILADQKLRVVELDGTQDTILIKFKAEERVRFAPTTGGQKLVVESSAGLESVDITTPFGRGPLPSF